MPDRFKVKEVFSPLKRKENNKVTIPAIVYIPFIVLYAMYGSKPHEAPVIGQYFPTPTPTFLTPVPTFTSVFSLNNKTITPSPTSIYLWGTPVPTFQPSSVIPAGFPWIKDKGQWYMEGQKVQFSYYYPPLGGTNCHEDNWFNGKCKNITASSQGWKEYLDKGIAVHPDMLSLLPFGSMVYVVNPEPIRGLYTVVDLCGGCFINGKYYFDFLFDTMPAGLNWSVDVDFLPVRIGWDGEFPPTSTPYIIGPTNTSTPTPTIAPIYIVITNTPLPTSTLEPTSTPAPTFTPTPTSTP